MNIRSQKVASLFFALIAAFSFPFLVSCSESSGTPCVTDDDCNFGRTCDTSTGMCVNAEGTELLPDGDEEPGKDEAHDADVADPAKEYPSGEYSVVERDGVLSIDNPDVLWLHTQELPDGLAALLFVTHIEDRDALLGLIVGSSGHYRADLYTTLDALASTISYRVFDKLIAADLSSRKSINRSSRHFSCNGKSSGLVYEQITETDENVIWVRETYLRNGGCPTSC